MALLKQNSELPYYESVRSWLEQILKEKFASCHLEVTAQRKFSNILQSQIDRNRDLIFAFLGDAAPDITGFVKKDSSSLREFVIVEIKTTPLKLDDIYQTRKYAELFDASYALLVSTVEVPAKITRLAEVVFPLLLLPNYKQLTLVSFQESGKRVEWFRENPFAK